MTSGARQIKISGIPATVYRSGRGHVEVRCLGLGSVAYWHGDWPDHRNFSAPMPEDDFERYMDLLEAEAIAAARAAHSRAAALVPKRRGRRR